MDEKPRVWHLGPLGRASTTLRTILLCTALIAVGFATYEGISIFKGNARSLTPQALHSRPTANAGESRAQLLADVTTAPTDGESGLSTNSVVAVQTTSGHLASVVLEAYPSGARLSGGLNAADDVWMASGGLRPNTTYQLTYKVKGGNGVTATGSGTFSTGPVPMIQMSTGAPTAGTVAGAATGGTAGTAGSPAAGAPASPGRRAR